MESSGKPQLPSSEGQKPVLVYTDREARPVVMLEMENIAYRHVEHVPHDNMQCSD